MENEGCALEKKHLLIVIQWRKFAAKYKKKITKALVKQKINNKNKYKDVINNWERKHRIKMMKK